MGKKTIFILVAMCILLLAGCENQGKAEEAENGDLQATKEENIEQENTLEGQEDGKGTVVTSEEEETASSLTAEQIEYAKQAALVYYEGTVFSVNSIEYLEGKLPYGDNEGGCNFTVNVSKGGVVQEPDRTISLQLDQDGWKVVNEGY